MMDGMVDSMMNRMLEDPYPENLWSMVPILNKVHWQNLLEAGMRATKGKPIERPMGSPIVRSDWDTLLFNPMHLFQMPVKDSDKIDTSTTIGPEAENPLHLKIPIMIAGMSYGGALSLKTKQALAKGASLAGTATNTGEAPLIQEERDAAEILIGQYNRGDWLNDEEQLRQLDAIEIQLGQGAQGSAPQNTPAWMTGPGFRRRYKLHRGEKARIHSRLPGVDSPKDFINLVGELRRSYKVPIGLKIAATHHLERELEIALEAGIDFFVVDGAEGGTHGGAPILQDDLGLPTLPALVRTADFIEAAGMRRKVSIVATGGLVSPGHYLKAMALGADAVYIGTIAIMALLNTQMNKAMTFEPAIQMVLYTAKYHEDFKVDEGALALAHYLKSCAKEMELVAYSVGKKSLKEIGRVDMCATDIEIARLCRIDYANYAPNNQPAWHDRAQSDEDRRGVPLQAANRADQGPEGQQEPSASNAVADSGLREKPAEKDRPDPIH